MPSRNQNVLFYSRLSAFLLLVVFVLLGAAVARSSVRVDLTEEGLWTLSDASHRVLSSLRDPGSIRVFWHNMPKGSASYRRYIASLLGEMKAAAGGKLSVRWVDLEGEEGKTEAREAGVQPAPYQQTEVDEVRLAEGYDSLVIEVADQSEVVDQLAFQGSNLEYEVVSRLHKMTTAREVVVGLVAPRPSFNPFGGGQGGRFRALETILRRQYGSNFRSHVSLDEPVPSDVDVLVVAAPEDADEKAVYHFEQYLLGGGRAVLFLDPVYSTGSQGLSREPVDSGFGEWLAHLGVTLEKGAVADHASFLSRPRSSWGGRMIELIRYPFWVLLTASGMDQSNPATRGFDQVPLFWPAAVSVDRMKNEAARREVSILGRTTARGEKRLDIIGLDQAERDAPAAFEADIPLVVLLEGPMESFWKGRKTPVEAEKEKKEAAEEEEKKPAEEDAETAEEDAETAEEDAETAEEETETEKEEGEGEKEAPGGAAEPEGGASGEEAAEDEGEGEEPPTPAAAEEEGESPGPEGEAPAESGAEDAPSKAEGDAEEEGPQRLDEGKGLLVVAGDAELIADDALFLARELGRLGVRGEVYTLGFAFLSNLVDWMAGSDDLLALRARDRKARQIAELEAKDQNLIKWGHMVTVPLLALLAGIVVFIVRRVQR